MQSKLTHLNLLAFSSLYNIFNQNVKEMASFKYNTELYILYETFWYNIIQDFISAKISSKQATNKMERWLVNTVINEKNVDWNFVKDLQYKLRPILFKHFLADLPGNVYWPALSDTYIMGVYDFADRKIIDRLFKSNLPDRHTFMDFEEQKVFNELPDLVTIYRGCSVGEIKNQTFRYSWSLDKDVAEFFANKRKTEEGIPTQVVEIKACKSKIIAYLDGREEKEVIYLH
nr:hypothetical protein [uncultured Flavobacterium sp.]